MKPGFPKPSRRWMVAVAVSCTTLASQGALPASAQTGWVSLGLNPEFDELVGIVADPVTPNVAYAALLVFDGNTPCGAARSEDWGLFWRPACVGLPLYTVVVRLTFAPNHALFALGLWQAPQDPPNRMRPGLFESTDGAQHWKSVGLPPSFQIECPGCSGMPQPGLAFDTTDPDTLYLVGESGLFRTRDHGVTWRRLGDSIPYGFALSVAVDPLSPRRIYVGLHDAHQGDGLYLSNNDGKSWSRDERGGPLSIVISPPDPAVVWSVHPGSVDQSEDRGGHWSEVLYTGAFTSTTTLIADAVDAQTAYLGIESGGGLRASHLVKTSDGGRHWVPLRQGLPTDLTIEGIAQSPLHPEQLLVADQYQVWRSQDAGTHWSLGGFGFGENAVIALAAAPDGSLYANADNLLYRFDRTQQTWDDKTFGPVFLPPSLLAGALTLDPGDPRTIYAGLVEPTEAVLFKSTDAGGSWQPLDVPATSVADVVVDPKDSATLYAAAPGSAASPGGVLKSTDAGLTWTPLGAITAGATELAVDPTTVPATLYTANGRLLKSVDGGSTWIPLPVRDRGAEVHLLTHLALASSAPQLLYALSEEGGGIVFRSRDGGGSWTRVGGALNLGGSPPAISHHPLAIDGADPTILYVGWARGVARSVGGGTWTLLNDGLPPSPVATLVLRGRQLLVGTIDAGAFSLSLDAAAPSPNP